MRALFLRRCSVSEFPIVIIHVGDGVAVVGWEGISFGLGTGTCGSPDDGPGARSHSMAERSMAAIPSMKGSGLDVLDSMMAVMSGT